MKHKSKRKGLIIAIIAVVLVIAIGGGCWFFFSRQSKEPVNVYSFQYIGMTEYWGDSQESYGPVTTDKIQTVFLSDTQTVTEILVAQGDSVKKGDLLMRFDTTLTDISLERERLKVEKLKLDLEDAKDRLKEIKNMKPMVIPSTDTSQEPEEEDLGVALTDAYLISTQSAYDGSTKELALICWLASDTNIDDSILDAIRLKALEYREKNAPAEPDVPATTPPEEGIPTDPAVPASETVPTEETGPNQETTPTEPTVPEEPPADPNHFYVVFKVTEGNMSLGQTLLWQGMSVAYAPSSDAYRFQFFDASTLKDHTLAVPETPDVSEPEIDFGSGYTSAQIAEMRSEQEKTIRDLEFQIKMAEADYKIMQTEVGDGNIYAEIDGTVVSLLSEEESVMTQQPILKVSGGGGFYMEGSISELEKDNLQIGQEVTVNDWNTGMTYAGTVESIGDYPASDGYWSGMGNPNTTYYPFTVFIDGSADLQAGSYISVMYSTATVENGIYLENPFLRTEQGKSYVYVQGEDGLLEKRYVTTGKSLWGSYTEILEGLTAEDLLAFPYGKNVTEGAPAVESDLSTLYE